MSTAEQQAVQAGAVLAQLEEHYARYPEEYARQAAQGGVGRNFARMFRRWLSYNDQAAGPLHIAFLEGTAALTGELAGLLAELEQSDPLVSRELAMRGVALLLTPKPKGSMSECEWYMTAAEYHCAVLLPYLSREDLEYWRSEMLRRTPRRMMFPKQLELLEQAEKLLKEK